MNNIIRISILALCFTMPTHPPRALAQERSFGHVQTASGALSATLPNEQKGDTNIVVVQLSSQANPVQLVRDTAGSNYTLLKEYGDIQVWVATNIPGGTAVVLTGGGTKEVIASEYSGVSGVDSVRASSESGYLINIGFDCTAAADWLVWLVESQTPFTWPMSTVPGDVRWPYPAGGRMLLKDCATTLKNPMVPQYVTSCELAPVCSVIAIALAQK